MLDINYFKEYFSDNPIGFILTKRNNTEDIDLFINKIDSFIFNVRNEISTSQFKKIYSEVRRLSPADIAKIKLIRIQLAYIAGRNEKSNATQKLCSLIDSLIQNLNADNLNEFRIFLEAIIAYHKYHNPKAK